ncbi:MAG: hypothetical protein PHH28_13675 [Desulfuromonadaceae bacterium]|nr:hypothetical protein [Desulfuromonadaceae bacterium]
MHKLMYRLVLPTLMALCLLLVVQSAGLAGPVPDGLAGVPWGATREQVKKIMIEKGFKQENVLPFTNEPSPGLVFYGSFVNTMCYLQFSFKGNSFYYGLVTVVRLNDYQPVVAASNHFISLLTEKYGIPDKRESYQSDSPGHPTMPYNTSWNFRDSASSDIYHIRADTIDSLYWTIGTKTSRIFQFTLSYYAESLGNMLKEDGL